ncbi:transcription-repair coupling factor [Pelotomaculum propionicicum]|uniref:Transcription-repair-coupling factor n=1 Tax=Pelotomaculum propionicicum TaxID=258475 RepID=A0A4Y7RTE5_9FIRM|nr:transcription-repair coupling factor [Pelotomaculum propionicicum]NLI12833.1 transcription-repair coupling factor [Peptococcaceae bacterium]TEB12255.1 Transcription-repair-coupling factor [Pelotomaculum propionicicum]
MRGILKPLQAAAEFQSLRKGLEKNYKQQMIFGLAGSQRSYLFAGVAELTPQFPVLIVTPGEREASILAEEMAGLLPGEVIRLFPVWRVPPYQILAHSKEVEAQRLQVLESLLKRERSVIIAPAEALLRRLAPTEEFAGPVLQLAVGDRTDLEGLLLSLLKLGYERVELVEERGQFGLRGGILDIYPMTAHRPVRLEFFDEELDSIRRFNAATQRSEENIKDVTIYPARELVISESGLEKARLAVEKEYRAQLGKLEKLGEAGAVKQLYEKYPEIIEGFDGYFNGVEHFLPYFYSRYITLFDYLPPEAVVLVDEPARVKEVINAVQQERSITYTDLLEQGRLLPAQALGYAEWDNILKALSSRRVIYSSLLPRQPQFVSPANVVSFPGKTMPSFLGNIEMLASEIVQWRKDGSAVVILVSSHQRSQQLLSALKDSNIDAFYAGSPEGRVRGGNVLLTPVNLGSGFELPCCRLVVITETDIYGQRKKARKEWKRSDRLAPFVDIKMGDHVVHVNHGIGRYLGVVPLTIEGIQKEYLLLKYAGEDKLYVPVDQVGLIQKYLGGEGESPRLSRLGGADWARAKSKVKEAVKEMAGELLDLYAARETMKGYAFGKDTVWQREFEDAFPYEETPDQLRAIDEIKADMERPRPMDRLLCGDVGYGKTEVALRAAFKAVMDGKQVAMLAPTTILAQQHYNTFMERLEGYPFNVEVLSRFRTPREQRQVLQGLLRGNVDVVIGTHRLLQEDVCFKDLGLLIVDEEQRFGVAHKERLKIMRKDVDVLTLSATPIPRTLHMSLVGIRDTSILETPPEDRYPVQTYVLEEEPVLIREAVRREIGRGGQVFVVYNRVLDLDRVAAWIQGLVPEARVVMAHGQMREEELEQAMLDFMNREYDVLVCTTIIENGLDLPNVNTLIVKESGALGLAQLYQLRGRVGRSNRLAYAYFTFRKDKILGEAAEKRLTAIREFTELGSGFKIAMRDLEIRGAGNILGAEQHGHIAAVGFDLYSRLLEEAVREARGEQIPRAVETTIELPVEAFIPDSYISDTNQKVEIYKRLAGLISASDVSDLEEELVDRFGDLPGPVQNLLAVAKVKVLAGGLKVKTITLLPGQLRLIFGSGHPLTGEALVAASRHYHNRVKFINAGDDFEIKLRVAGDTRSDSKQLLSQLEDFLVMLGSGDDTEPVSFAGGPPEVATGRQINL